MVIKLAKILPLIALLPAAASADYILKQRHDSLPATQQAAAPAADGASCKEILDAGNSSGNGLYLLDNGVDVYCDMTTDGGGWTMVVAQFEVDPVTNWNEGTQADYDPTLGSEKSFALSTSEIPSHSETAFGQGINPSAMNFFDFVYTTGDIALTTASGKKDGATYQIHRNSNSNYAYYNPEEQLTTTAQWNNAITADKYGGRFFSWAFAPMNPDYFRRGYALNGFFENTVEPYAWTIWVR